MKGRNIKPAVVWQKTVSMSLTLVFVFGMALQALHDHCRSVSDDRGKDPSYVFAGEKCAICDYLINHQAKHACLSGSVSLAPSSAPVALLFIVCADTYKPALQVFINKGPPLALSQTA